MVRDPDLSPDLQRHQRWPFPLVGESDEVCRLNPAPPLQVVEPFLRKVPGGLLCQEGVAVLPGPPVLVAKQLYRDQERGGSLVVDAGDPAQQVGAATFNLGWSRR